jgi:hypothetical protein
MARRKKGPAIGGASFGSDANPSWDQWPKNNHNRMITGIGTPSSQSKMPRPIVSSMNTFSYG